MKVKSRNLPPVMSTLHKKPVLPHYFYPDQDAHVTVLPEGFMYPHQKDWPEEKAKRGQKNALTVRKKTGGRRVEWSRIEKVAELTRQGRTARDIAIMLGMSRETIAKYRKRYRDHIAEKAGNEG